MNARPLFADYLNEPEPTSVLWPDLVKIVYAGDPRQAGLDRLSPWARLVFVIAAFDGEVLNGGFSQFFSNSSGNRTHETLSALDALEATVSASLLREALLAFPNSEAPTDRTERCQILFAFEEQNPHYFDPLDRRYYRLVDPNSPEQAEDLDALLLALMKRVAGEPISA